MKIYVAGNSHLTHYTKIGAAFRGLHVTNDSDDADLILIAEDTPTNGSGVRVLRPIETLVTEYCGLGKPVILMSQVPPGFCRNQNKDNLFHYPETLRIRDSYERACKPEYIVIGVMDKSASDEVWQYVLAFNCPHFMVSYETAEMCKIAVNTMLAMQVEYANRMEEDCGNVGADWNRVKEAISLDKRIGPHAYLTPGRWQDSLHLLRDYVTLKEIEDAS